MTKKAICPQCKKEYIKPRKSSKYCSLQCQRKGAAKNRAKKTCSKCSKKISPSNYQKHYNSCNGIYFEGPIKPGNFSIKNWIKDDGLYHCPSCEKTYEKTQSIISHYWSKHTTEGKKLRYKQKPSLNKPSWCKGLTSVDDIRVRNIKNNLKKYWADKPGSFTGRKHTKETKEKISISKSKHLQENNGKWSFGHCGRYDNIWFDSSLELAFYVYHKDNRGINLSRNRKHILKYEYKNETKRFIPDFIDDNNNLYEIKMTILTNYDDKTPYKMDQCPSVIFLFRNDIEYCINYCKEKYGTKYHNILYEKRKY